METGKGVGTKIMFGMRIGIRLGNLGRKLGWKFGIRIGMVMRMGTGGRIRFMLGIGSRGYGLGLKL